VDLEDWGVARPVRPPPAPWLWVNSRLYKTPHILTETLALNMARGQIIQVAQLSHSDRDAGWVSYGLKWKTGTGRQYFTDIIGLQPL